MSLEHETTEVSVVVLVPCFNEEATIGKVVEDFRAVLPDATVWVYDNASTDRTAQVVEQAGATVRREPARPRHNSLPNAYM